MGIEYISKRLDRFMIKDQLVSGLTDLQYSVYPSFILDHLPILLSWTGDKGRKAYPFKFNHTWLLHKDFIDIIHKVWNGQYPFLNPMDLLCNKLQCLKRKVRKWVKYQRIVDSCKLDLTEASLWVLFYLEDPLFTSEVRKMHILELEAHKRDIYKAQELAWRLKSLAIWVEVGD